MIKLNNLNMIGEYVLVQPVQTENTAIILRSHDDDKMLMGTVMSVESNIETECIEDDDGDFDIVTYCEDAYVQGDMILFNRAKSLPVPREPHEDEMFIVRRVDVFGTYDSTAEEA